jgi:hypothetical protein
MELGNKLRMCAIISVWVENETNNVRKYIYRVYKRDVRISVNDLGVVEAIAHGTKKNLTEIEPNSRAFNL